MRLVAQPRISTAHLEAQAASDARWLVALLRWLGAVFEHFAPLVRTCPPLRNALAAAHAHVMRELRGAVRDLRFIVVERANARLILTTGRTCEPIHPGSTRDHAHRARRRTRFYRRVTSGLFRDMHQGTLRQRAERLAALLANLDPLIARAARRLRAMWRCPRLTQHACVVSNDACDSLATECAIFADTS